MNKLKNFFDVTMIKFILVGIVNTAVGMGTMFICYNFFHLSYWISSASNYVVGSIVSYFLKQVQEHEDRHQIRHQHYGLLSCRVRCCKTVGHLGVQFI